MKGELTDFEKEEKWNSWRDSSAAAIWLSHFVSSGVRLHTKCPQGGTMDELQSIYVRKHKETGCSEEQTARKGDKDFEPYIIM